jgi:hypothetical protein
MPRGRYKDYDDTPEVELYQEPVPSPTIGRKKDTPDRITNERGGIELLQGKRIDGRIVSLRLRRVRNAIEKGKELESDELNPENPFNVVIENMKEDEYDKFCLLLRSSDPNAVEVGELLNDVARRIKLTRYSDDTLFKLSEIRHYLLSLKRGRLAGKLSQQLEQLDGLEADGIVRGIVYDCYSQAQYIAERVFAEGANVTDKDLLNVLPKLQVAAIKGAEGLEKIKALRGSKRDKLEGARMMAVAMFEIVQGTQLEGVMRQVVADVVLQIEVDG